MNVLTSPGLAATDFELVERKGSGHPDTLADGVAEAISRSYSTWCLDRFGAILHHNTDKTALLGGAADVRFGHGQMTAPVHVMVNGRITPGLGDVDIPVEDIVTRAVHDYFAAALPLLDPAWLGVRTRLSTAASPGAVTGPTSGQDAGRAYWFRPRTLDDLAERHRLFANDTSAGVGYAPAGTAERVAVDVEAYLGSEASRAAHPYLGTDTKLMVTTHGRRLHITACVPQIAAHTPDLDIYLARRDHVREIMAAAAAQSAPGHHVEVAVNTRDDAARCELYLTATGSSIESGDEGVVGRGNRANGVISMFRPWSAEGVSGKNPVYHVGKLYNLAAARVADALHEETGRITAVALVSQSGRDLDDPRQVMVQQSGTSPVDQTAVRRAVGAVMGDLDGLRSDLLAGKVTTA